MLTASADTREGPVKDLFSNFLDKSPDSLFRRIDPDYHYPTFGDDGIVEEDGADAGQVLRQGRATARTTALWGNFKIGYMDNELAQVDRGLYGANAHCESDATTSFGEQRVSRRRLRGRAGHGRRAARSSAARAGRSTSCSNQDILTGSERVRIEMRDKDSGLVTGVVNLRPASTTTSIICRAACCCPSRSSSTGDDNLLVRSGGVSGDEAYLVVRYEYTPGFDELDALRPAARATTGSTTTSSSA